MPRLAAALCILWVMSLFVVRTLIQWRRTGSTGLRGFHGRVGSLSWLAGVSVTLGMLLTMAAPVGALLHWPGAALAVSSAPLHLAGVLCFVAGTLGALSAQLSMGDSWRVGVDETETTDLVTTGLFAWVRNPIFSFMGLSAFGLLLIVPNGLTFSGAVLAAIGVQLQVRAVEEPYLKSRHGKDYHDYASHVGRFIPGVGRVRCPAQEVSAAGSRGTP
jgi:protein-S-isoprenylcysteine O-methyltransferase Ste14